MRQTLSCVQGPTHIRPGYELGVTDNKKDYYIFNHLVFNVLIHKTHGEYTRAQNSAYSSSIAVDTSGRRMLSWPKDTPQQVPDPCLCLFRQRMHACTQWQRAFLERALSIGWRVGRGRPQGSLSAAPHLNKGDENEQGREGSSKGPPHEGE